MTAISTHQRFGTGTLLLLFSAFWSLKTMHVLLLHHHHDLDHPVCEISHDPGAAHIHDERWAVEDCTLCAFTVSVPEPFILPLLEDIRLKTPESSAPGQYATPFYAKPDFSAGLLRGPPANA